MAKRMPETRRALGQTRSGQIGLGCHPAVRTLQPTSMVFVEGRLRVAVLKLGFYRKAKAKAKTENCTRHGPHRKGHLHTFGRLIGAHQLQSPWLQNCRPASAALIDEHSQKLP